MIRQKTTENLSDKIKKLKEKKKKGYLRKISDLIFDYMEYGKDSNKFENTVKNSYLELKYNNIIDLKNNADFDLGDIAVKLFDIIKKYEMTKQEVEAYEYFLNLSKDDFKDKSKFKDIFYNVCYKLNKLDEYETTKLEKKFVNKDFIKGFLASLADPEYKKFIEEIEGLRKNN